MDRKGFLKSTMVYIHPVAAVADCSDSGMQQQQQQVCSLSLIHICMILPAEYEMMTWLGRGPQETYADRKTGALIGLYNATVWEQYHPYVRAQETANHCDVRWVALRNATGEGLLVVGEEPLSVSAWNFPMEDIEYRPSQMERRHGGSIQKKDMVLSLIHISKRPCCGVLKSPTYTR